MMFLMQYDRIAGHLVTFRKFDDTAEARQAQFALELDLHRKGIEHEVVLLEAESEAAIRRTHRRYFEDLPTLLKAVGGE
jgi:hypothetical protein